MLAIWLFCRVPVADGRRSSVVKPVATCIAQTGLAAESDQSENSRSQLNITKEKTNTLIHLNKNEIPSFWNKYLNSNPNHCVLIK